MPQEPETTEVKGTLSLIPQIFYDIIARLVPGLALIILSYLVFWKTNISAAELKNALNWFSEGNSSKTFMFFSMLLISYMLSVALGQVAHLIESKFKPYKNYLKRKDNDTIKNVVEDFNGISSLKITNDVFPEIHLMYDYIRMKEPGVGARIVKLRAEYNMCLNLSLGLLIIVITDLLFNKHKLIFKSPALEILILLAVIIFFMEFVHRKNRYTWGCCNHWLLLRYSKHIRG